MISPLIYIWRNISSLHRFLSIYLAKFLLFLKRRFFEKYAKNGYFWQKNVRIFGYDVRSCPILFQTNYLNNNWAKKLGL